MGTLQWQEVSRTEWEHPAPPAPNGSSAGGTDYGVTILEQATWPQDGSVYAGRTYEQCWIWQGPDAKYRDHVIISHSQYPAHPARVVKDGAVWRGVCGTHWRSGPAVGLTEDLAVKAAEAAVRYHAELAHGRSN